MNVRVAARKASEYLTDLLRWTEPDDPRREAIEGLVIIMHDVCAAKDQEQLDFFNRLEVPYR